MSFGRPYISRIEGCVHDGWLILRNTQGLFYYDFLYYLLLSHYMFNQFCKKASGSTVDNLNIDKVANAVVPIPPIDEQMRIVEQIERVFEKISVINENQRKYTYNFEVLKSKLINAGIQGKLTEQLSEDGDVEVLYERLKEEKKIILKNRKGREDKNIKGVEDDIPYELPQNWKWVRLGEIGLFKKGPFGSALTKSMFVPKSESTVKVYEQQHAIQKDASLGTYYISREYFDEKMSGFEVESGDIIISCAGTIGETYILPEGIEQGIINQALMRVVLVDSVDKKFFQYYFDANLKKMAQNESNGSAIKNIPPFDVMKNWYFPLTSLEEQRRIVGKLNQLLDIV
jgi:type I restriction enzyme S subunit